nr:DUF3231 family protein [Terribacillus saccharophilus]
MGILSGNPQDEPLHYGEVYGLWTFVLTGNKMIANHQMLLNHVGDDDLKKLIGEAIDGAQAEVKQVSEILKANGIALPPAAPEPPKVDLESIPVGARFIDPDVATTASAAVVAGLVSRSTMMSQSIREDVGMMFGQFHTNKAMLGAKFLKLLKEKGWLIPPPLHQNKED